MLMVPYMLPYSWKTKNFQLIFLLISGIEKWCHILTLETMQQNWSFHAGWCGGGVEGVLQLSSSLQFSRLELFEACANQTLYCFYLPPCCCTCACGWWWTALSSDPSSPPHSVSTHPYIYIPILSCIHTGSTTYEIHIGTTTLFPLGYLYCSLLSSKVDQREAWTAGAAPRPRPLPRDCGLRERPKLRSLWPQLAVLQ